MDGLAIWATNENIFNIKLTGEHDDDKCLLLQDDHVDEKDDNQLGKVSSVFFNEKQV